MTGSFLFVKPSDPEGKHGTAYSDDKSPRYPYDRASWEWLLERALRRTLIPLAITKPHSRDFLYSHEGKYSMHRWGSYGAFDSASAIPSEYPGAAGIASGDRKTDADLSGADRISSVPEPTTSSTTKVTYGVADLEESVAILPFSLEWLHPDWSSSALDAWDLEAKTTESTNGYSKGYSSEDPSSTLPVWGWVTDVERTPYKIPDEVPFKCLSHMRTDDDFVTVGITNDDDETIMVETAPTPSAARRALGGSILEINGKRVRDAKNGAAYLAEWALSEFSVPYRHGLDYGQSTSEHAFGRDGKTSDLNHAVDYGVFDSTIGYLADIPNMDEYIAVSHFNDDAEFVPDVDWDGKPTYWHANGFPKGLDSVLSPKLKTQLKALCPECQPAIPPAVPAFVKGFPDAGHLPWDYGTSASLSFSLMYPWDWLGHFTLACTPLDISARLDAMTTTVHRVPLLFAKTKNVITKYNTSRSDTAITYLNGDPWYSWEERTSRTVTTTEGTLLDPIQTAETLIVVSGDGSGSYSNNETETVLDEQGNAKSEVNRRYKTQYTWGESYKSDCDFLVCLRSNVNTTTSTKETIEESFTHKSSSESDSSATERTRSSGELPDSYDPDPEDLFFPDWVLPWIESAELFVSVESFIWYTNGHKYTEYESSYTPHLGDTSRSHAGDGNGSRTHKAHRKFFSLGEMDTSTGRFPAIDVVAAVLSKVDPDPDVPLTVRDDQRSNYDRTYNRTDDNDGNTKTHTVTVEEPQPVTRRVRRASYYVVVKWKFDRTDPETLATDSSLPGLYRTFADANKELSDKNSELSDAEEELSTAESDKESAEADLDSAQERLDDPEGAEADVLAEAQDARDSANDKLSDAQSEKSKAQETYTEANDNLQSAEGSLESAQAEYDKAVADGTGVEEAKAALESAHTAYYGAFKAYGEASRNRGIAVANETLARLAANAAQEYYDALLDENTRPGKIKEVLQKAVDDAKAAVDEATLRVNELTKKVKEANEKIPTLTENVYKAKQAIIDAEGVVPSS